jgi:predicted nucleotidyltransferase
LLTSNVQGSRKYYQANRQAPIYPELKSLLIKTVGLGDILRAHLPQTTGEIAVAFLYGSYALGTDTASSDVDVMVVGSISSRSLTRLLAPARESLAREISPVVFTEREFRNRVAHGNHFLLTVWESRRSSDRENELERIAGTRQIAPPQEVDDLLRPAERDLGTHGSGCPDRRL